ncbi:MAG: hypothetical protein QXP70_04915 [Methanomassiliicoccales archaeon]
MTVSVETKRAAIAAIVGLVFLLFLPYLIHRAADGSGLQIFSVSMPTVYFFSALVSVAAGALFYIMRTISLSFSMAAISSCGKALCVYLLSSSAASASSHGIVVQVHLILFPLLLSVSAGLISATRYIIRRAT